jgi:ATP-dependent HslUV protease, peptidase subunit HslV
MPRHERHHMSEIKSRAIRSTTILGVLRDDVVAMAGDGQVTVGDVVLKHGARKIRTLSDGAVIAGFAGAVADALTLFSKFETQLKSSDGNLRKASVELAKEWRTDRYLRRLEAQLIVGDGESLLVLSGEGDVIEPDDGIAAIGSGAPYATAAAKALLAHTDLPAREIVESAMGIAAELCIFTNDRFTISTVPETTALGDTESDVESERIADFEE